jgi:hypothetical protein
VWEPVLPLKGEHVTLTALKAGWTEVAAGTVGVRSGAVRVPWLSVELGEGSSGALRVFFRDERGQMVGDSKNLAAADGRRAELRASDGLRSELEYADLAARPEAHWTVEIREGPDAMAPGRDFNLLLTMRVPWDR